MHTDIYIIHFLNSIVLFLANRVVEESLLKATCFNQRRNFPFLECPLQQHILQRHSFHLIWESCLNRFWFAFLSQWFYRQCSTSKSTFRKQLSSWKTGVERESSVWTAQLQKNTTENPYQSQSAVGYNCRNIYAYIWDIHLNFSVEIGSKVWLISSSNKYKNWFKWGNPSTKHLPLSSSYYKKTSEYYLESE